MLADFKWLKSTLFNVPASEINSSSVSAGVAPKAVLPEIKLSATWADPTDAFGGLTVCKAQVADSLI